MNAKTAKLIRKALRESSELPEDKLHTAIRASKKQYAKANKPARIEIKRYLRELI